MRTLHSLTKTSEISEVGIYKRKQENKNSTKKSINKKGNKNSTKKASTKSRKHELDQESNQEKKKIQTNKKLSFFLDHFLGRVLVLLFCCFLTFLFYSINSHLKPSFFVVPLLHFLEAQAFIIDHVHPFVCLEVCLPTFVTGRISYKETNKKFL